MKPTRLRTAGTASTAKTPLVTSALFLLFGVTPALAQAPADLQYLIFEPVPISVQAADTSTLDSAAADPEPGPSAAADLRTYQATELARLPANNPIDLSSWLVTRQLELLHADPPALEGDIGRYESAITALELSGGPYDPRMDQELLALGTLYQQSGQFTRALGTLEQAIHINRVNNGLFNLGQIPMIEKSIENHLARGDLIAADAQHEYLFYLQRKSLGEQSVDLLPALTRFAEWNVFAFNARPQLLALPAQQEEEVETTEEPAITTLANLQTFRTRRLINAQNIYQAIIQILVNNFGPQDPRLVEFEKQLALTNYFFATTFDAMADLGPATAMGNNSMMPYETSELAGNSLGYRQGKEALERRIRYLEQRANAPALELARARTDLGDWLLRFRKRSGALEEYARAYQELQAASVPQAQIDALLKPALPLLVPSFLVHPYTRAALDIPADLALEYRGYIDVEFSINRFGSSGGMRVLGKSASADDFVESLLLRYLRRNTYRPRHDDGVVRDNDTLQVRYYFTW